MRADDEVPTIDWILERAASAVMRYGTHGLIIDPYNEIEHKRPAGMTETEYVSQLLGKVKRFILSRGVHCWFVAHPTKPQKLRNGSVAPLSLYDIAGSANFVNKADIGIVVGRREEDGTQLADIDVKKVRFKQVGRPGKTTLMYDRLGPRCGWSWSGRGSRSRRARGVCARRGSGRLFSRRVRGRVGPALDWLISFQVPRARDTAATIQCRCTRGIAAGLAAGISRKPGFAWLWT
jgi:hypothetical protein